MDLLENGAATAAFAGRRDAVAVSAATGAGVDALLDAIEAALPSGGPVTLHIPHGDGAALALCYERGRVLARTDRPEHVALEVELPAALLASLHAYRAGQGGVTRVLD
jgi:50S ribosomal subunit-associated GTPase HflX